MNPLSGPGGDDYSTSYPSLKRPREEDQKGGNGSQVKRFAQGEASLAGLDGALKIYAVTILVPNNSIGLLIGKGGSVRQQITQESGAKFRVQDYADLSEGSRERGITLSGSWESIERAQHMILEKLKNRRIHSDTFTDEAPPLQYVTADGVAQDLQNEEPRLLVRWLVPQDMCGLLIGKKGAGIHAINTESGAKIKIGHEEEMPPGSGERVVYIAGTKASTEKALALIRDKVGGRTGDIPHIDSMTIPLGAIGHLLGATGSHIRMVRDTSGAKVHVTNLQETEMGSTESKIYFDGTQEQTDRAKVLMTEKLKEWETETRGKGEYYHTPTSDITTIKMAVPFPLVGHLIGKGGVHIKEMLKTGALVKILQDEKSHTRSFDERPIIITGPTAAVLEVQKGICDKIISAPPRLIEQIRPIQQPNPIPTASINVPPPPTGGPYPGGSGGGGYPSAPLPAPGGYPPTAPPSQQSYQQVQQAQALLSAYGFNLDLTSLASQQPEASSSSRWAPSAPSHQGPGAYPDYPPYTPTPGAYGAAPPANNPYPPYQHPPSQPPSSSSYRPGGPPNTNNKGRGGGGGSGGGGYY